MEISLMPAAKDNWQSVMLYNCCKNKEKTDFMMLDRRQQLAKVC